MFGKRKKKYEIRLDGISIEVRRKKVKNLNIRVYPADRTVKISAPHRASDHVIRKFAESRREWITRHFRKYERRPKRKELLYVSGEALPVWGKDAELEVIIRSAKPKVVYKPEEKKIRLFVRPGSSKSKKAKVLKEWYRAELKREIPKLIDKWEEPMRVKVSEFGVKQMKTRWGTCNIRDRRIWLNLELAKKDPEALEYVVVHEMVHLLERLHNKRFYAFMDRFLPDWKEREQLLKGRID